MKKEKIFWILISAVFAFLNILGTKMPELGKVLFGVEYAIIIFYTIKEPSKGFLFLILFSSVTLEFDQFIYFGKNAPFKRYNLFSSATVYFVVSAFVFCMVYGKYKLKEKMSGRGKWFMNWMYFMGVVGVVSFFVAYLLNDNGIANDLLFFDEFRTQLRLFVMLAFTFASAIILMRNPNTNKKFKYTCYYILLGVTAASIVSILVGFRGYYGGEEIMLAPLVVCFAPCILAFVRKDDKMPYIDLGLLIVIFLLSLSCPNAMGSKWYLIVFASLLYFIWRKVNVKSNVILIILIFTGLYIVPIIGELLTGLFSDSSLAEFKLSQALGMLDFLSSGSFESWFMSLDRSAQFRVDEPWNIFLEFKEKPEFAIFGKGIGGTITQHTSFLDWSGPGAFSNDQIRYGVYFNMHETLAMLFLRHGFVGLFFFGAVIILLFKRMNSPWSLLALLWFIFFWTYGISFKLGAVALAIAFSEVNNIKNGENHYKS